MKYKMKISCFILLLIVFGCIMIAPVLGAKVEEKLNEPCPFEKGFNDPESMVPATAEGSRYIQRLTQYDLSDSLDSILSGIYYGSGIGNNQRYFEFDSDSQASPAEDHPYMYVQSGLFHLSGGSEHLESSASAQEGYNTQYVRSAGSYTVPSAGMYRTIGCHQGTFPNNEPYHVHSYTGYVSVS